MEGKESFELETFECSTFRGFKQLYIDKETCPPPTIPWRPEGALQVGRMLHQTLECICHGLCQPVPADQVASLGCDRGCLRELDEITDSALPMIKRLLSAMRRWVNAPALVGWKGGCSSASEHVLNGTRAISPVAVMVERPREYTNERDEVGVRYQT